MTAEGGGANQQGIATLNRLQQRHWLAELAVEAVDAHAGAGNALANGIGDGGGVAVGAGIEQSHFQLRALLGFSPAAVVRQQAAPAVIDGGPIARRDADSSFLAISSRFSSFA